MWWPVSSKKPVKIRREPSAIVCILRDAAMPTRSALLLPSQNLVTVACRSRQRWPAGSLALEAAPFGPVRSSKI